VNCHVIVVVVAAAAAAAAVVAVVVVVDVKMYETKHRNEYERRKIKYIS
jgi:hypothetical protein